MANTIIQITIPTPTLIVTATTIQTTTATTSIHTTENPAFFQDQNVIDIIAVLVTLIIVLGITVFTIITCIKNKRNSLLKHDIQKRNEDIANQVSTTITNI